MIPDRDNLCILAFDENQGAYFSRCCSILTACFALAFSAEKVAAGVLTVAGSY